MHTSRNRQVFLLICILLYFACMLSVFWKYPLLDTTTLYLPIEQFPSQLTSESISTDWQPVNEPFLPGEKLDQGPTISMDSWVDKARPAQQTIVNQLVYGYQFQPAAIWSFFHYSGRPTPGTIASTITQSQLPTGKRFADQEQLLCINGDNTVCNTWCYWSRYGQYVIRFYILNEQQRLDRSIIFELIERRDQHVQQRVQSGRYR